MSVSRVPRACRLLSEDDSFLALPLIAFVFGVFLLLEVFFAAMSIGPTVRPGEFFLNLWLALVLGASYVIWAALRARGVVDSSAWGGFVLAAVGLWARLCIHLALYSASETYGSRSAFEDAADGRLRFMIGAHRYGGLLAFALGLGLVAWGSFPNRRWDRAARARSGSPPTAGPEEGAAPTGAPPS